jgi:hypothetical protein
VTWCVDQQEFGDVFSNHRLKSLWALNTKALRLFPSNLTQSIYRDGALEYLAGTNRLTFTGAPATWPNASNSIAGDLATDFWTSGVGSERRNWRLETTLLLSVSSPRPPIVSSKDLQKNVTVTYASPVPALDDQARIITRTNETVRLGPCRQLHPGAILQEWTFTGTNSANGKRVTVQTSYYWPKPPGAAAGYTAPLIHFVETRITGLATNEIVLHDYYSQTYRPGHHNFSEEFIFEPRLDPDVAAVTVQELNAAKIQFLHIHRRLSGRAEFTVLGTDGVLRRW